MIEMQGNTLRMVLPERLNQDTAPAFEQELMGVLNSHKEINRIELDGSVMQYISSAGIRVLLGARKKIADFHILHLSEVPYEAISITGMEDLLGLEPEVDVSKKVGSSEEAQELENDVNSGTDRNRKRSDHQIQREYSNRERIDSKQGNGSQQINIMLTGINNSTVEEEFVPVTKMFEDRVRMHPKKLACVCKDWKLTYEELNRAANRVANQLIDLGIGCEDVVCILLNRSLSQYIATLGVLKAGAAYVVLNTEYPDERISFICKDAGCRQIISTRSVVYDRLELFVDELGKRPIFLEDALNHKDESNPKVEIAPEDLCYCIYTSGSTGRPKGVMIEHGNLSNFLCDDDKNLEFMYQKNYTGVFLAMAEMTFDVSVMEEYVPLVCGHTVAFAGREEIMNPDKMLQFMEANHVDGMSCTPSYLAGLLRLPKARQAIAGIRVFDIGAEAFPATLYTAIRKWNPEAYIVNGYGPTETTISCTMKLIDSTEQITIGTPNANVYVFVVDEQGNEVEPGATGELLICGKCVGRGYVGLQEKTEESFISFHGLRGYRSGDLVRINENQEIEYLGRKDYQVKLRGLRIELGEIESVIGGLHGITHCAAAAIDNRYLCLYYVASREITQEEIREYAGEKLTEYMIPDICTRLEQMPMTANMKIDRRALPKPVLKEQEIVPPSTPMQEKLLQLVTSVMEDVQIGVTGNLLEIGMSSLDIMLLLSLIGDEYQVGIKVADIYEYSSVVKLEEYIMSTPKLKTREVKDRYRASSLQAADYYNNLDKGDDLNIPTLYEMDLSIDLRRLQDSVMTAIKAHPGLTMRMESDENGIVWQIPSELPEDYEVPIIRMTDEEFDCKKPGLSQPILCSEKRLFRLEIIDTGSRHFLFTDFSHAISDGESIRLFMEDVASAYEGKTVEPETYSMFEHGEFLSEFWDTPAGERGIDLYMAQLSSVHGPLSIPADQEKESVATTDGQSDGSSDDSMNVSPIIPGRVMLKMDADFTTIEAYCKDLRISENALFSGLLGLAVLKMAKRDSGAFSFAYNGRNDFRLNRTFGFIAALIMPTFRPGRFSSIGEYFKDVQKQIVNLMIFPEMPIPQIMGEYENALDVTYIYQPFDSDDFHIAGTVAKGEFLKEEETRVACKTVFQATAADGGILWIVDYFANLYRQETIEQILKWMNDLLNAALTKDHLPEIVSNL